MVGKDLCGRVEAVEAIFGAHPDGAVGCGAEGAKVRAADGAGVWGGLVGFEVAGRRVKHVEAAAVRCKVQVAMAILGDGREVVAGEGAVVLLPVREALVSGPVEVKAAVGADPDAAGVVLEKRLDGRVAEACRVGWFG